MNPPMPGPDRKLNAREATRQTPARVLVVSDLPEWRARAAAALRVAGMNCELATSAEAARLRLLPAGNGEDTVQASGSSRSDGSAGLDVVVVDAGLPDGAGLDLVPIVRRGGARAVLAGRGVTADLAVDALRVGVSDVVNLDAGASDLALRVEVAARRARASRGRKGRIDRLVSLGRMCRRLRETRDDLRAQVEAVRTDLCGAYEEFAEHMNQITTASEFKGLIRQELDIENLLRTTLEFVLGRSGPTNAAVFLPTTSGDYSLGAYVNYDCPKDTCDILLDHLANSVAPKFEKLKGVLHATTRDELDAYIDGEAAWLGDSHVVAYCCRHDGETLAIFLLFRDKRSGFAPGVLDQVRTIGELFAAQLARVIHIHHRHLPKHKWGMLGDAETEPGTDDYGLAA